MAAYLDAARHDRTWQQLKGANAHGELTGTLYIASTDPETSNSGALYLAAASYVANGGKVVASRADVDRTAPLLHKLLGELLSSDPALRKLVVRHGFRPQGDAAEFVTATGGKSAYLNQTLTGVRQAPVPTSQVLHEMARRARG